MGCVTATAKRRRRQAVNKYRHLPPMKRPHYATHTKAVWEHRSELAKERRKAMEIRTARRRTR